MSSDSKNNVVGAALVAAAVAAAGLVATRTGLCGPRKRTRVVGVIPARYKSTRFPAKPLVEILGKPMIQWTYEQAKKATTLDTVVVATDDERIAAKCREFGAEVVMTSESCPNGTERCNEAVSLMSKTFDIVVNIQGDEPMIEPEIIDAVVRALQDSPDAVYSTACTHLKKEEVTDRNRVKCITDKDGYAIYFSRGMIPHNKDGVVSDSHPYLLHLGLQCYDRKFLAKYPKMPPTPLQMQEDLEQLKVVENGYKIKVVIVDHEGHGVDSPSDIPSIENLMRKHGMA
eukprot:jgi/Mesvir1/17567/Mv08810-RA.1